MSGVSGTNLHWSDILVIVGYFVGILAVGLYSARKSKGDSISGYFLASKNMHWIPVGASLFASNIGSGHFIGLAGSAAASGIAISVFELNAMFVLIILGWVFVPVYMASGVYTMPEYLRKRFGRQRIRIYLSVLALILYVFTKISADLYAGAIFIEESLGWNLYASVVLLLAIAALFTISGGLTAVIWTDFAQTILMIIGAFILMFITFDRVNGYERLTQDFFFAEPDPEFASFNNATNESCGKVPDYAMHFFRDPTPGASDLPWTGLVFGLTISAVWYWCSDQVIVQRALAAKSMVHAKSGCIMAGYLKFLPLFLLVFPGMAARVLYPNEIGCASPEACLEFCGNTRGCTNVAYPRLVVRLMPAGLRGMMLSVMMAALMSSLTSIFNSASTIFTLDIYQRIREKASEVDAKSAMVLDFDKEVFLICFLSLFSRVFVLVLVGVSIVWIPVIQASKDSQLFNYIQSITSFLSPPICAVYVLAIAWDRITEPLYRLTFGTRYSKKPRIDLDELEEEENKKKKAATEKTPIQDAEIAMKAKAAMSFEEQPAAEEGASEYPPMSIGRRILNTVCGVDTRDMNKGQGMPIDTRTREEKAEDAAKFMEEPVFWSRVVNINALLCIACGGFVFGYYG
ncbi:unnamed protein product [Notodromas monacha]|uniref:Sodium/glucose cotransporter n=1 Tax=Notodromas monacha TaxID=399045 RepID=A0A7R9G9W6_9CRUS|nr:unnamed protein product [Notodromas monacha]CAG0913382.1 unnamed protein product [Notodromas monacha]